MWFIKIKNVKTVYNYVTQDDQQHVYENYSTMTILF